MMGIKTRIMNSYFTQNLLNFIIKPDFEHK